MSDKELSREILSSFGGETNISVATHCATRLRLTIKNEEKVNEADVKKIKGVLGLVKNENEYQVIIGTNVSSVYLEFSKLGDFGSDNKEEQAGKNTEQQKKEKKNYYLIATDFIAGTVLPTLPIIVAGGMMSAVLVMCKTFFNLSTDTGTYTVFNAIYSAAFTFLPIFIGYNAAKKLTINPMLGSLLGAILVSPDLNGVEKLDFLGVPITTANYGSTILPVIFGVLFMAVIYKPLDKYIPKEIKFFFVPLLTMIITVPVTLICLAPIGTWLGQWIGAGLVWLNVNLGWLSVGVIGAVCALLVFTGTGTGLYAAIFLAFSENGFENFIMPGMLAGNLAIGGAAIAAMTLLKEKDTRAMAFSSGLTAVFGITEPAIFGVLIPYQKPFISAAIGGGIGGLFAGFTHVAEYAFVSPGVASIVAFINPDGTNTNLIMAVGTMLLAFVSAFIATRIIGIKERVEE
ncbi:PTS transporter subunit EIIC [Candidatus Enterococcus murrayae]|uniref:PTS transporter subunit EIIC n=1 Tax=Candidatus Enterococcus murrayae TaxID=2815321 RepID=A0ABS3HHC9_9ENTE|nr:PTS transporter subunit EIIC [Enterococcus sp. MJM16]MBO0452860.1 PTS transporter subunit EIIC [Enterococcus sp. MJM16]